MDLEGAYSALSVEVRRWATIRSEGIDRLKTDISDADEEVLHKSLQGEYNSHIRRIDSLWRQFTDDYKRQNGVPG